MTVKPSLEVSPTYGIGVVSRLTGINQETLRMWERRYQMTTPIRTGVRRSRFYSQHDVDRLTLVKALIDVGHPVSSLAKLGIDEMRLRLETSSKGKYLKSKKVSAALCRVVALGSALATRLAAQGSVLTGIEVVAAFSDDAEFEIKAKSLKPDLLLIDYPTLRPDTPTQVSRQIGASGASHAVVIFGFGAQRTIQALERAGVTCLQAPVKVAEIQRACVAAWGEGVRTNGFMAQQPSGVPMRRFTPDQLARIAVRVPSVSCECPHHLVDLVNSLVAFETYSNDCKNLNSADAEIHTLLHLTTASARSLLETALVKLTEFEGITVD